MGKVIYMILKASKYKKNMITEKFKKTFPFHLCRKTSGMNDGSGFFTGNGFFQISRFIHIENQNGE